MNLLFWGLTIGMVGKVILGIAVLRVHMGIMHEHKIDGVVIKSIQRERWVTFFALFLILLGYTMEIVFYEFTPLFHCPLGDCGIPIREFLNIGN